MITRIELENFKGIREPVSLDLKPITLLFGANSSGKSTVIHALHYALEVLKNHNLDADRTTLGGEAVDLGGFRTLVHAHDLDRRVRMLFEFDVDGSLRDYTEGISDAAPAYRGPPGPNLEGADLEDRVFSAWVRVEVGWSRPLGAPQVFFYEVGTNGNPDRPTVRIEAGASKGQTATLLVQADDGVWGAAPEPDDVSEFEHLLDDSEVEVKGGLAALPIYGQESALPHWGRPLRLWLVDDMEPIKPSLIELRRSLSRLAIGVGELLVSKLEQLLYVGPLRTVPPRNYRPPLTENLARWAEGLGAWDALHRGEITLVSRTNKWMGNLETGYQLELRHVRQVDALTEARLRALLEGLQLVLPELVASPHSTAGKPRTRAQRSPRDGLLAAFSAQDPELAEHVSEFLDGAQETIGVVFSALQAERQRPDLVLVDERNGVRVQPPDVGVGISQVLPVIVAALYRGERGAGAFVVVEQPELHIHPKLQVKLADLFIEQACAGSVSDHQFLLETHSEHILLRLLRRIRESSEDESAQAAEAEPRRRGAGIQATGPRRGAAASIARGTGPGAGASMARRGGPSASPRRPGPGLHARQAVGDEGDVTSSPALTSDKVSVIYVQRAEDGSAQFVPLGIDAKGEFSDVWPEGFFDERMRELY